MLGAEPAAKSFFLSTAQDMVRQKDAPQVQRSAENRQIWLSHRVTGQWARSPGSKPVQMLNAPRQVPEGLPHHRSNTWIGEVSNPGHFNPAAKEETQVKING
ncbi:hypothetical protein U9M48_008782 [Paspalum notatum var. saurae]|uniref:Uncharacterized protein n=1 Tax=Paspalum notatum var. saurae TaxID=547442 RepID=A0AAQ3WE71_PASNO